jgi:NAD(P)-dependent dehydrogenase (short-subunit alcohol dehydrogenase family)
MGQTQSASLVVSREAPTGTEFSGRGAAVVTGATSGLGIPTTVAMLRSGFDLVFATARSAALATALRDEITATLGAAHAARLRIVMLDFTDLRSVRAAAAQIDRDAGPAGVAVLCNNAGINTGSNEPTRDGLERQIGVNHIAPVCFTDALLPALSRSGQLSGAQSPARIVFVSSNGHKWALGGAGFDETLWTTTDHSLGMWSRYGQSKLCNVLAALDYDAAFQRDGVPIAAFSLHPGVVSTNIVVGTACAVCLSD